MEKFYDTESRLDSLLYLAKMYLSEEEREALRKLQYNRFPIFERDDFDESKIEAYLIIHGWDCQPKTLKVMSFIQLPDNALNVEYFNSRNAKRTKRFELDKEMFKRFLKDSVLEEIEDYIWDSID